MRLMERHYLILKNNLDLPTIMNHYELLFQTVNHLQNVARMKNKAPIISLVFVINYNYFHP